MLLRAEDRRCGKIRPLRPPSTASPTPGPDSAPAARPDPLLWILALAAVLALWMDLSPLHRFHDSDSLVPVLMSLDRWEPFYWEQNRFGMLVPLLALAVREPFHNLLFQVALRLAAVVLSFFLLARTVVPRPYWPAVGAATLALYVGGKGLWSHCFIQMQPYPQALALALAGVACLDGNGRSGRLWRTVLGAVLISLAFWVSLSLVFCLLPLLALRLVLGLDGTLQGSNRRFLPFALVGIAFGASLLAAKCSPWGGTDLGPARAATWPHAWATLAGRTAGLLGRPLVAATGAVLLGSAAAACFGRRPARVRLALAAGLCLLGTAAAELAALGTSSWVHLNDLSIRFFLSGVLATATALPAMLAVLLLEGRPRRQRAANALAVLILLPVVLLRFGPPSAVAARAAFDRRLHPESRQIVAAGCTHVAGSYWTVWPAVLRADQLLWERGERRRVWGITARSRPIRDLWQPPGWRAARVAALDRDPSVADAMKAFAVPPLFLVAARPGVRVYSGTPPAGSMVSFPPLVRGPSAVSVPPSQEPRIR